MAGVIPIFLDGFPCGPSIMMAAILLGEEVAPPPATFESFNGSTCGAPARLYSSNVKNY